MLKERRRSSSRVAHHHRHITRLLHVSVLPYVTLQMLRLCFEPFVFLFASEMRACDVPSVPGYGFNMMQLHNSPVSLKVAIVATMTPQGIMLGLMSVVVVPSNTFVSHHDVNICNKNIVKGCFYGKLAKKKTKFSPY